MGSEMCIRDSRCSGTRQEAGYGVSHRGGRPSGTTQEAGYSVDHSRGRPRDIQFPEEWDHSEELVNISASLLDAHI